MIPRFGGHGGGHGQPALRIESYNHGGIFPLSIDCVNLSVMARAEEKRFRVSPQLSPEQTDGCARGCTALFFYGYPHPGRLSLRRRKIGVTPTGERKTGRQRCAGSAMGGAARSPRLRSRLAVAAYFRGRDRRSARFRSDRHLRQGACRGRHAAQRMDRCGAQRGERKRIASADRRIVGIRLV